MNEKYINKPKVKLITWFLGLYLILTPLDFLPVVPGVSLSKILIFLPLICCLFYIKGMRIRLDRYLFITILYFFMVVVTMFYSYDQSLTQQRVITIGLNISIIIVLSMFAYNDREKVIIIKSFVFSGWFTLLLIIFYSNTSVFAGRMTVIVNGVIQDPNYLCGFLVFSIIYYYSELLNKKKKSALIKLIAFLILVLLTGSRGGLIAILGALFCYSLIWVKSKKFGFFTYFKLVFVILVVILFFSISLNFLPDSITKRYEISFTQNDDGAGRFDIWVNILNNYKYSPIFHKLFGWGAGTITNFNAKGAVAHNVWVESLIEIGIIGLLILFAFYFLFIKRSYKIGSFVATSTFMGYMIMSLSMSLYSYKPIWNIILLIILLNNSNQEKNQKVKIKTPI